MLDQPTPPPKPVTIGVTGHRDIAPQHIEKLKEAITKCLNHIQQLYPDLSLIMLNSLAAGADLLAAQVAQTLQIPVIAPLPMPIEEYEQDFESPQDKEQLYQTLQKCSEVFVVDLPTLAPAANPISQRDLGYFAAAYYVVKHANILIALWNGEDNQHVAGTAKTVQMMLEGYIPPEIQPTTDNFALHNTSGIVYHIVTPRVKSPFLQQEPFSWHLLSKNTD